MLSGHGPSLPPHSLPNSSRSCFLQMIYLILDSKLKLLRLACTKYIVQVSPNLERDELHCVHVKRSHEEESTMYCIILSLFEQKG